MAKKPVEITLNPAIDIFSSQDERDMADGELVRSIPINLVDDFPNHPFKVHDDEDMEKLVESIEANGILVPILVRPLDGRFQLISGHRRKFAAIKAGLVSISATVREYDDDEAIIAMVDANMQREFIPPTEKGFAYRMKLEALKHQGQRSDLTSNPVDEKWSVQTLADESGDSSAQIQRYIRLTNLIDDLREKVDQGSMGIRPAVELSFIDNDDQFQVMDQMEVFQCSPTHEQAKQIRKLSEDNKLTEARLKKILSKAKPNQQTLYHISYSSIERYFKPGASQKTVINKILKALDLLEAQEKAARDLNSATRLTKSAE